MKKIPVLHALIVVLAIFALSACAELNPSSEMAVAPEAGVLVDSILDSKAARTALIEGLEQGLRESPVESPSLSQTLVSESLYIDLYQRVNPAVVNIQVTKNLDEVVDQDNIPQLPETPGVPTIPFPGFPELQPGPLRGQGSGFIYDTAGHIITNNHVVDQADKINVIFADGSEVEAVLIGADPDTDLAVIKVEEIDEDELVSLKLADSDRLQIGQHVVAIGNPFGLSGSMTTGIISGLGRVLPASASQFSIPDIIQTDAAINPGNSGGPLLDLDGQVVGVNTAIASSSRSFAGVGYAVPSNMVNEVVPELIAHGRVLHPWLGITGRTLDRETAMAMSLEPSQRGILIAEVVAESPADESGLRGSDTQIEVDGQQLLIGGDVIVGIDDQTVDDFDDLLSYIVNETEIDQQVALHLLRDGEPKDVEVRLAARPVEE
jgi:serine protease Do